MALSVMSAGAQRLSVQKTTVDVGRTGYRMPVTATFELRNRGLRRLVIQDVDPDCECTKVEFPKGEIGIGERFTIRMTYDARQLGHFNKQAAIISNGSRKPVYVTMTGVVLADLMDYSSSYPYDYNGLLGTINNLEFDDVNRGDLRTAEMRVMNNGTGVMQPNILHLPPYLTAEVTPRKINPGQGARVLFTLHSEKIRDLGLTQTSVYLAQQLGEKVKAETEIPVSTVLLPSVLKAEENAPRLVLSDSTVNIVFGGRNRRTEELILRNSGYSRLDIRSLQMFTRGLRVTLSKTHLNPGETAKMKVTAVAGDLKGVRSMPRVLMITNDPQQQKIVIKVNCK